MVGKMKALVSHTYNGNRFIGCLFLIGLTLLMTLDSSGADDKLEVGIKISPPFCIDNGDGTYSGLSIDLWEEVANREGWQYEYEVFAFDELLKAVESAEVDIAMAALTLTAERERVFDFSNPYFHSGLAIAVRSSTQSPWLSVIKSLFSWKFLLAAFALLSILASVGLIVWFVESRNNRDQFGGGVFRGVGNGIWWSAVTMTTVGYGDKTPATFLGRVIGLIWMFASVLFVSSMTAGIASSLTINQLGYSFESARDLAKVEVGVVGKSAGADFLDERRIPYDSYGNVTEAMNALSIGTIDAFVYDRPLLRHELRKGTYRDIILFPENMAEAYYAFALPVDSSIREKLNQQILDVCTSARWDRSKELYLGD